MSDTLPPVDTSTESDSVNPNTMCFEVQDDNNPSGKQCVKVKMEYGYSIAHLREALGKLDRFKDLKYTIYTKSSNGDEGYPGLGDPLDPMVFEYHIEEVPRRK
ncbi:hypothetical protein GGI01_002733 [Coemansia sp. RSA 376]|nr:hypothetical protein GGH13_004757 [Coemansia sp. S155-1]KAJ2085463.1 hypothetical protein GGI16_006787 [Coemansia sp. S142-1]KAJ2096829.1 hypothetical protein GGI09_004157 [Coemansia sp. S100]KAJ2260816.1 hypothetical protein GGI01_002733 [Coemansia sp. RSA 376]KAJ2430652.1 hypothetical protein GGF41_000895 [Coemansia sp. RSA 2531]KAJ2466002.1 hypothetical protein GGI03_002347 [Coemansia sp. RSA 2337]